MTARVLLNRVEAHLLDGLDTEGREEILFAIADPDGFADAVVEREEQERLEQDEQLRQTLLNFGGEIA